MGSTVKSGLIGVGIVVGLMIAAAMAVQFLYPSAWHPLEATVQRARIERTRPGTPQWSLMVDATYEVAGRRYETSQDVFHDAERSVTEAEQARWPAGRTFTLYVDTDDPESTSLVADGGRQAATVVAVILTPLILMVLGFIVILVRQARERRAGEA